MGLFFFLTAGMNFLYNTSSSYRYGERKFLYELSNWIQPNIAFPLTFQSMLNEIPHFFDKLSQQKFIEEEPSSDDSMLFEESTPPPIQFSQASILLKPNHPHKRAGTEINRDPYELKKVMKTPKEPLMPERVDEFDASAEEICDFIINSQTSSFQNEDLNKFSFPIPQNNFRPSNRTSDFIELYSTQEATNSNIMDPLPQFGKLLFEAGNSMQSCDSSGKMNEKKNLKFSRSLL